MFVEDFSTSLEIEVLCHHPQDTNSESAGSGQHSTCRGSADSQCFWWPHNAGLFQPSHFCLFGVVNCPAMEELKLVSCIPLKSQQEWKSLGSPPTRMHQPASLPSPCRYSRALAAFRKMGFAVEGIKHIILFQLKGVIHDSNTFNFQDCTPATKLLEDFRGKKGRQQSCKKRNVTTMSALTLIISPPSWCSSQQRICVNLWKLNNFDCQLLCNSVSCKGKNKVSFLRPILFLCLQQFFETQHYYSSVNDF